MLLRAPCFFIGENDMLAKKLESIAKGLDDFKPSDS